MEDKNIVYSQSGLVKKADNLIVNVKSMEGAEKSQLYPPAIPKIIHQTWKGPPDTLPKHWKPAHKAWVEFAQTQGWTYLYWTDNDIDQLIEQHYGWFLEQFRGYRYGIQRADAFRYFALHRYGGLYVDMDIGPNTNRFQKFYDMVQYENVVIPYAKNGNDVGSEKYTNSIMMSQRGSSFWPEVWKYLKEPAKNTKWKNLVMKVHYFHILFSTGPGIINEAAKTYKGDMYRAANQLLQPGDEFGDYPIKTPESAVVMYPGQSWHQADAQFWMFMGQALNNMVYVLAVFLVVFIVLTIWIFVLYKRQASEIKSLRVNRQAAMAQKRSRFYI